MSVKAEVYADIYQSCINATTRVAGEVPEDKRLTQAADGKAHPLWLVGHLAMSMDMLVGNWVLGADLGIPPEWGQIFGPTEFGGRAITANAADYPSWDDVVSTYKKSGDKAVAAIRALSDDQIDGEALGGMPDQFRKQFGNCEASLRSFAAHDSHHRGQITLLAALD